MRAIAARCRQQIRHRAAATINAGSLAAEEHRAIMSAIKQRNRRQSVAAMRAHIESSCSHIMRAI